MFVAEDLKEVGGKEFTTHLMSLLRLTFAFAFVFAFVFAFAIVFASEQDFVLLDALWVHPASIILQPGLVNLLHVPFGEHSVGSHVRMTLQVFHSLVLDHLQVNLQLV